MLRGTAAAGCARGGCAPACTRADARDWRNRGVTAVWRLRRGLETRLGRNHAPLGRMHAAPCRPSPAQRAPGAAPRRSSVYTDAPLLQGAWGLRAQLPRGVPPAPCACLIEPCSSWTGAAAGVVRRRQDAWKGEASRGLPRGASAAEISGWAGAGRTHNTRAHAASGPSGTDDRIILLLSGHNIPCTFCCVQCPGGEGKAGRRQMPKQGLGRVLRGQTGARMTCNP